MDGFVLRFDATGTLIELREPAEVTLEIVDVRGRRVLSMARTFGGAGRHEFVWNGTDQGGAPVGSGVYVYRLSVGDATATRKMLMTR